MNFYLDEEKAALDIIKKRDLGYRPSESICLLAKYYIYIENKNIEETENKIIEFIKNKTKINYKPSDWEKCITKNIKKAENRRLIKIKSIDITKTEIEVIKNLNSKPLERLAFTLLCLAKYHNQVFEKNSNWVNCPVYQIFKIAGVSNRTQAERLRMLNELYRNNMIKYSKKNTNTNICVDYVCDDEDVTVKIVDMREIGKEYLLYCGNKYMRCEKCGILFKPNSPTQKYCKPCAKYIPISIKTVICCNCEKEFEVDSKANNKKRCNECQKEYIKEYDRARKSNHSVNQI